MDDADRKKLEAGLKFNLSLTIWSTAIALGIFWLMYLLKLLFGIDVIQFLHPAQNLKDVSSPTLYLIFAIVVTVAAIPWLMAKSSKMRHLSARGVAVDGTVVSIGLISKNQMIPATIQYTVDGKEYTFKKDMYKKACTVGASVRIVCDPQNPTRREVI